MHIAICTDISAFQKNKILDGQYARRFPGAGWVSEFLPMAGKRNIDVATGDVALAKVEKGEWDAKDIMVIQELFAHHAKELIMLGARPFILSAFESPLIAYDFYDGLREISENFPHRLLFPGAFGLTSGNGQNHRAYFPNFDLNDIKKPVAWNRRKFIVMVAANKFWRENFSIPFYLSPLKYAKWLTFQMQMLTSATRKYAVKHELQSKRLEAIECFGQKGRLDLFGHGWQERARMPDNLRSRLDTVLYNLSPKPCRDKTSTVSGYKFAVCFENTVYPGYITEKIIDCFAAGVIPIYLGAPDIEKYIPQETFIDTRKFSSWQDLDEKLVNVSEFEGTKMINAGRKFLKSREGRKYSYSGFAEYIDCILSKELEKI